MQPHRQMLDELRRDIARQRSDWRAICESLGGLRPEARLHIDPAILADIDAACSAAAPLPAALPCGVRA